MYIHFAFLDKSWACRIYENGSLLDLVETAPDANEKEMNKVIEIGMMCTQSAPLWTTQALI